MHGLISHKNRRILTPTKIRGPPLPPHYEASETSDMTSEGLGDMFEGDSADACANKIPLMPMGVLASGSAYARPSTRRGG